MGVKRKKERRRWPRDILPFSEIGIIYPKYDELGQDVASDDRRDSLLVYILNRSEGGLLLESPLRFEVGFLLDMRVRLPREDVWQAFWGKVVRVDKNPDKNDYYFLAVELHPESHEVLQADRVSAGKRGICPSDLAFFMRTQLFDAISDEAKCPLLNCMTPRHIQAGERFLRQGDEGGTFYVIQEGSCVVNVEKDGIEYPVARLRAGDIVGEIALLTGEPRSAHVDTESDVKLWAITKAQFDALCKESRDVHNFLTELVTRRLSSESVTADLNVGKYVIDEIIGRGGWSIVYKGRHRDLNMPVAIKMLKHDMATDPDFSDKFRHEAKTIANFNHENIVKVYDIEELYRTIFIIMEYLEGMSLDYILEKMPKLPLSRVLDILLQVCAGLNYAHGQDIVHQDIKPANIFVQPNDRVKIVDFGLACAPGDVDCSLRGTIFYGSPEQIESDSVDERADIYSLGITAFEMITGQRPFPEDDITKMIDLRLNEDIPDPRTFIPDLPDELYKFVMCATQRDPAARYESVSQALHDLGSLAEKMGERRQPQLREEQKMMSLFLFYQDKHELALKRLVESFSHELNELGAELRAAEFKDV